MIRRVWRLVGPWLLAVTAPVALGAATYGMTSFEPVAGLILLALVVALALWSGKGSALVASVVSGLVVNFCLTEPVGSLRVAHPIPLATLSIFIAMAVGVSTFVDRESARELASPTPKDEHLVEVGDLVIDLNRHEVMRSGAVVPLTPTEWSFLELLARRVGTLVPRDEILRMVWGPEYRSEVHYLRVYIGQLRRKLEDDPANPRHLITSPGQGYILQP